VLRVTYVKEVSALSLDGFLTFFGLLIAGYAILDPISRLKLRVDAPIQLALICTALLVILPFEFIVPILSILPEFYVIRFVELGFGQPSDLLSNSHIAFIATFTWAIAASICFYLSRPRSGKLRRLLPLVERLHDEGRYLELLELVEPYLLIMKRCALRESKAPKRYDKIAYASRKRAPANELLHEDHWRSPGWCRWLFVAMRWVHPSFRMQTHTARLIADILAKSKGVRDILQTIKPAFAAEFFFGFYETHYTWCDLYIADSMMNKDSHLRQDIKRADGYSRNQYHISHESVVLAALVGDAQIATKIGVWKPVGDAVTKAIKEDKAYQTRLHEGPPQEDVDLFDDITYAAIHFFDILVRQAAAQGHMDHMWLMYLRYFVMDLEGLPQNTSLLPNPISEFSDIKEKLVFRALTSLEDWVELDRMLPDGNPHKGPKSAREAEDVVAIPFWAAQTLCGVVRLVVLSPKLNDDFKVACLSSFIRTGARAVQTGSYLRTLLADGFLKGDNPAKDKQLLSKVKAFRSRLDLTHLSEFNELGDQLK